MSNPLYPNEDIMDDPFHYAQLLDDDKVTYGKDDEDSEGNE